MKFIRYSINNYSHIGVIKDGKVFKTNYSYIEELFDEDLSKIEILEEEKEDFIERPIIESPNQDILCLGMNYRKHKDECLQAGLDKNEEVKSVYFSKRCQKAITNNEVIDLHKDITNQVDYEGELGVILKKDAYKLKNNSEILDKIFGYCIINDVSARDIQSEHQQFLFGKSLDTFTSISSVVVTADEFGLYPELDIKTFVNSELRQNDNTKNMIFNIPYFMKELTSGITLEEGSIIATGTPSGVGKALNKFLNDGDIVEIQIEKIGNLVNICRS